jgi:hypothetical protein
MLGEVMKVELKEDDFKPITIILETKQDKEDMVQTLACYLSCNVPDADRWHTIDALYKMLK